MLSFFICNPAFCSLAEQTKHLFPYLIICLMSGNPFPPAELVSGVLLHT
ncbi:hypothetical protein Spico_1675 [Parasphaerochaeta coccoides DSM 17374]|uniref:Uncharacterized protein n=1 Tax=Parasphaerochaeta coccoides (strain ATCC BAA-1237 / DSM 17374 / SPN1) TaxID=760011 RepID=F4GKJ0_PARC1|nr:hypothetical protein Spico_1675 [Parasphaerochaeta coccoides DSM 17374]